MKPFRISENTLARRRLIAAARRWAAACCAALAVFVALQYVGSLVRMETVVVASADIARGQAVDASSLAVAEVPAASTNAAAFHRVEDVGAATALVAIARGQPVFAGMVSDEPKPPDGTTAVEVRLASMPDGLLPGDKVDLVSSSGCGQGGGQGNGQGNGQGSGQNSQNSGQAGSQANGQAGSQAAGKPCTLASAALTLSVPVAANARNGNGGTADSGSGLFGANGNADGSGGASRTVAFALKPKEALAVLAQQEAGPLLAVARPAREVR
ncbi:SAF domain-containing protein [Bifidobacterium avesanii]|nr:SAF domain-containing protein [Bifidobacterium avesanii]KAB8294636.1 hypothetical protein DSM100685_0429 [Bifidobacterium avesanii]